MVTEEHRVCFAAGDANLNGFLSGPASEEAAPGLVLVPDVRGLYEHFEQVARRFAAHGLRTLAVDLYSREGAPQISDLDSARAWMEKLPDARVLGDIEAAVAYLAGRSEVDADRVGVTGFCMGGQYALMAACTCPGLAACVSWYGMLRYAHTSPIKPRDPLTLANSLRVPLLAMFGEEDPLIPRADVEELRNRLEQAGRRFEIEVYEGAGHAFFNDTRPDMYRPAVAARSWQRALAFLDRYLGPTAEP